MDTKANHLKKTRGVMNLLTKEECNEALEHIKTLRGSNYGGYYSGFNNSALPFDEDTNVISKLIKEHFDKETPLKVDLGMFASVRCHKCGAKVNKPDNYCSNCGQKLDWGDFNV